MAKDDREKRLEYARGLIIQNPEWGKDRINKQVKARFGVGLRRIDVARLKDTLLIGRPKARTGRKSIAALLGEELITPERAATVGFDEAYMRLRSAGFIDMEIRNIFSAGNTPVLFTTEPFKAMLKSRRKWFRSRIKSGWSKGQVISAIRKYYSVEKRSPFDFLRREYKPPLRVDFKVYREAARKRAVREVKTLYKR